MTDTADTTDSVRLERDFDAPADLVWQMFVDPEHFAAWYGPMGASIPVCEMDVQVGGRRFVSMAMTTPDGDEMQMFFVGEFVEITPTTKLVYTESLADAEGNAQSPATEVTVELRADGGATHLTLVHAGVPAGSPGEMGWTMALDKLADRLAA